MILDICERVGATHCLSGEGARCYQQAEHVAQRGLVLEYHTAGVSPYPQCHAAIRVMPSPFGDGKAGQRVAELPAGQALAADEPLLKTMTY